MSQDPVRLLPPAEAAELPAADADGQRVLDRVAEGSNVVVLGAPGTGKTSLALRLLADVVVLSARARVGATPSCWPPPGRGPTGCAAGPPTCCVRAMATASFECVLPQPSP